jgi:lambda repressor-like predicted transcriptional regulator
MSRTRTKTNEQNENWIRHALISQSLKMRGMSFSSIARKAGVSPALVTMVSKGQRSNAKVRQALARACSIPVKELWRN